MVGERFEICQSAPLLKLYSMLNPEMRAGESTVNCPHSTLTGVKVGAGGAGGNLTALTMLLTQPVAAVPAKLVVPQSAVNAYLA